MCDKKRLPAQRADFVGSFLRPQSVKQARLDFAAGSISQEQLKAVEDEAIRALVARQVELGFKVITDGEFRRQAWHLDFMWGFNGVGHAPTKTGLPFHGEQAMIDDTFLTGKLSLGANHPFIGHFKFVNSLAPEGVEAKLTIPAPAQFLAQMVMPFALENTRKYYADNEALIQDMAKGYRQFIREVYAAGCRRLQFDDCTWGMLVDPAAVYMWGTDEAGLKKVQEMNLRINNMALEGKPADLFINTHVCRGNYHSTYANSGAYDKVAEVLFEHENVNAYYLEFDDERSGGFAPLSHVSGDKMVVLGLITTKSPRLEFKSIVAERIRKAAEYLPLERLCLSPQCGFASCEIGNKLTEEEQWAKLRLVQETAKEIWG
jgi:methionine synthase II (cobalamin-independent)